MIMKRIIKVCFVTGLICLLTVLCCLPFVNFKDNKTVIHADEVVVDYTFESSVFLLPISLSTGNNTSFTNEQNLYAFKFSFVKNGDSFNYSIDSQYCYLSDFNMSITDYLEDFNGTISSGDNWVSHTDYLYLTVEEDSTVNPPVYTSIFRYLTYYIKVDTGFTGDVVKIDSHKMLHNGSGGINGQFSGTSISFFDVNNKGLTIQFPLKAGNPMEKALSSRIYFLLSDMTSNDYYLSGYNKGKEDGLADGQQSVYDSGFKQGKSIGFELGRQDVLGGEDYTLLGFIGGIVDVPIKSFVGLLNFDILGFNVLKLVTGCLTIGLVFIFVRFIFFRGK